MTPKRYAVRRVRSWGDSLGTGIVADIESVCNESALDGFELHKVLWVQRGETEQNEWECLCLFRRET